MLCAADSPGLSVMLEAGGARLFVLPASIE